MIKQFFPILLLLVVMVLFGCNSSKVYVKKGSMPYSYMYDKQWNRERNINLKSSYNSLFSNTSGKLKYLRACFTAPRGYTLKFYNNTEEKIGKKVNKELKTFYFTKGIYPFAIYKGSTPGWFSNNGYSPFATGIIQINPLKDRGVELALFGLKKDTKLFNIKMLNETRKGHLTEYTITFDNKEVIKYWMGNRKTLYAGGAPNVEFNFSGNKNLKKIMINDEKIEHGFCVLDVYLTSKKTRAKYLINRPLSYEIKMVDSDGHKYKGFITDLKGTIYTAFVTVPCTIPPELFKAARNGTISKFTVYTQENDKKKTAVAKIVFGIDK